MVPAVVKNRLDTLIAESAERVLAYLLTYALEHRLKLAGETCSWWTTKSILRTNQRMAIEYTSKDEEGTRYNVIE
jgi:hypothetical protein